MLKTCSKKFDEVGFDSAKTAAFAADPAAKDALPLATDLSSVKALPKILDTMQTFDGKNAWKARVKGLESLQKLLTASSSIVVNKASGGVCRALKTLVTDAMPRVKTVAATTIAMFADAIDPQPLRKFNRLILDELLDTLVDTKPMVVAAGMIALSSWVGIPAGASAAGGAKGAAAAVPLAEPLAFAHACRYFAEALKRHPSHGRKLLLAWLATHVAVCVPAVAVAGAESSALAAAVSATEQQRWSAELTLLVPSLVHCITDRAHEVREGAIAVLMKIVSITGVKLVESTARDMPRATQLGMRKGLDRVVACAAGGADAAAHADAALASVSGGASAQEAAPAPKKALRKSSGSARSPKRSSATASEGEAAGAAAATPASPERRRASASAASSRRASARAAKAERAQAAAKAHAEEEEDDDDGPSMATSTTLVTGEIYLLCTALLHFVRILLTL